MRSSFALHFRRQRSLILRSNSTEVLSTRRYSASTRARSSSIRRSIPRQCSAKRGRDVACYVSTPVPLLLGTPQVSGLSSAPSIWMRLGSCTAAAPATLTSSTPSLNRALMLLSSVPCGNDMLLRNDP
jgi:hypothetical protein